MKTFKKNILNILSWKNIKKQKYGWFTSLFYGIGTILGGFSTAFLILANNSFVKNTGNVTAKMKGFVNISAGLWMTLVREMIFMIMFFIFYGIKNPKIFKNLKYSFSRGGRLIIYSVIFNFVGDVAGLIGIVLLLGNTSLSSVFETSFIIFTFIVASFTFKHKFNWKSFIGVMCVTIFMLGIFFVDFYNHDDSQGNAAGMQALIGMLLMFLANVGYLLKNIMTEYVYKNRLLDTQTTQLFATFYAFVVGLIIVPLFFFTFQPLLLGNISALPWKLLPQIVTSNYGGVVIMGVIASVFLLTGRNFQYANTMISGASVSNIFYQGKLIVVTILAVPAYAILSAISGSVYPYTHTGSENGLSFSNIMAKFNYDNWIYWVLIFLLFFSIIYTVLANQDKYEKNTYEYRKKRNVKRKKEFADDKFEKDIYDNKTLDEVIDNKKESKNTKVLKH